MSKKEMFQMLGLFVIFMLLRIMPELLNIDDGLFIAIFEALSGFVSILALVLVAIQIKNTNQRDERTLQAILRHQIVIHDKTYFYYLHNIGQASAYDVNVEVKYIQHSSKKVWDGSQRVKVYLNDENLLDKYNDKNYKCFLGDDIIKSNQYIIFSTNDYPIHDKKIIVTYRDLLNDKPQQYIINTQ